MTLVERSEQLRAIVGYVDEARAGHGRLVYVSGEAGIGKTSFVMQAVADAGAAVRAAVGACDGSATPAPLGPLVDLLPHLPAGVWPEGATRHEVFTRVVEALRTAPSAKPYLLVIEDLHWADEASLDLVRHVARRVHGCHAVVLVTFRPDEVGSGLRVLLGDTASANGTRRIDLPALTPAGVAQLAAALAPDTRGVAASLGPETKGVGRDADDAAVPADGQRPADVARLHAVTGGNAFFVTEVLAAGGFQTGSVPPSVRDAVLARVARLPEHTQRALEVVALTGARAEVGVLDELLRGGVASLDEPLRNGLLVLGDGEVTFRHELGRLAVAEGVPAGRRIHVHRRLLATLSRRSADASRLAHHADAAGDSAAVLVHAPVAAAQAARLGAHKQAVEQYRRALAHGGRLTERLAAGRRAQLLWDLGYELYLIGDIDASVAVVDEAREIWDAEGDALRVGDAWRCLSRLHWFAGRNATAEVQARSAIDTLAALDPTPELALAYSNQAQLHMLATDLAGTREWGRLTLDLVDALPDGPERTAVEVHAQTNLGTIEVVSGDLALGTKLLTTSLATSRAADLHEHAARAYCNLASTAVVQRRNAEATRYLGEGIDYCGDRDLDSWVLYLTGWRAAWYVDRGDMARARADAEVVLRAASVASVGSVEPLLAMARVLGRAGADGVVSLLDQATQLVAGMTEVQRMAPLASTKCELAWIAGDLATIESLTSRVWPVALEADCPWNRGSIARWRPDAADAAARELAPPYAAEVAGRWREAAGLWAELDSPFDQALALARSGEQAAMTEAVAIFESSGAPAAADRTRLLLKAAGWAPPRGRRAATRAHPAGLTPREAEVLDLVARGLGDAAIAEVLVISRRTAEHHVASILSKLGASSRQQLANMGGASAVHG